jgi:hypothetical protein
MKESNDLKRALERGLLAAVFSTVVASVGWSIVARSRSVNVDEHGALGKPE